MDVFGKLFGSSARVKIIRLFLLNPNEVFETRDVKAKSQVGLSSVKKELARLGAIGLIKQKIVFKKFQTDENCDTKARRKKIRGWLLSEHFFYLDALKSLLLSKKSFERDAIVRRFRNIGRIKLLIISGIFIQSYDSRADILIVGDYIKKAPMARILRALESEIGKELRYGVLETKDFLYRFDIYDKFVRDILDYPHEKLINKIGIK